MLIKYASENQIVHALEVANEHFGGNLTFNRTGQRGKDWLITLRVRDSRGPGHRLSPPRYLPWGDSNFQQGKQRRLISACWHAHGRFIDALPESAVVLTARGLKIHPGDPWNDFNIGSQMFPYQMSEACECPGGFWGDERYLPYHANC